MSNRQTKLEENKTQIEEAGCGQRRGRRCWWRRGWQHERLTIIIVLMHVEWLFDEHINLNWPTFLFISDSKIERIIIASLFVYYFCKENQSQVNPSQKVMVRIIGRAKRIMRLVQDSSAPSRQIIFEKQYCIDALFCSKSCTNNTKAVSRRSGVLDHWSNGQWHKQ